MPDDLDAQARAEGLNISALTQVAIADELDRRARMAGLATWLDELDEADGPPSARQMDRARP